MAKISVVDPRLKKFHQVMRALLALKENQDKADWRQDHPSVHIKNIGKHFSRLAEGLCDNNLAKVRTSCANLANFAFILFDLAGEHEKTKIGLLEIPGRGTRARKVVSHV